MRIKPLYFILTVSIFTFTSCASFQTFISQDHQKIQSKEKNNATPVHSLYLIGDAGGSLPGSIAPALKALQLQLQDDENRKSLIFLGDNIYPHGMVPKSDPTREECEYALKLQLDVMKNFSGKSFIIPGNHDWRQGLEGLKRQEDFVDEYLDDENSFLPRSGCAGPEVISLSENILLVIVDSEWWLRDWNKEPEINRGCKVTTRSELIAELSDILKKNQSKEIVLALHHPLFTYGIHGGYYTFKEHLFPFIEKNKKLLIPLPFIGSLYPLLRGNAGIRQDHNYPPFAEFRDEILKATKGMQNVIFVSGHEHNLQYIVEDQHPIIISGAGSKNTAIHRGKSLKFGSSKQGFAVLDFFADDGITLRFYAAEQDGSATILFETQLQGSDQPVTKNLSINTEYQDTFPDSIFASIYPQNEVEKSRFYQWFWGKWYRSVYGEEIHVPTLDLTSYQGGLYPTRRGGGTNTLSLRLKDDDGHEYLLRGMQKNAISLLPSVLQKTFVTVLMQDFFTTAHPYAVFVVPKLADAVSVYHANPKLYYVPKQAALEPFNQSFGDALYLFEERAAGDWKQLASFGNSKDIIGTDDLLKRLRRNDRYRLDRDYIIRSRLFDLVIQDWDRHQDQWRWAEITDNNDKDIKYYRPIPRDRDQVFAHFDGFLTGLATRTVINLRPMKKFKPDTRKVHWLTWGTRHFDRRFLNEASWPEWQEQINNIKVNLTDAVISEALQTLPERIYQHGGDDIVEVLKSRRENLPGMAERLYGFLARSVDVVGTYDKDYFLVERLDSKLTRVSVYNHRDRETEHLIYQRTFEVRETKEINLYGLDDDDYFEIAGDGDNRIKIRLIGGHGKDHFRDKSSSPKKGQILVYDDLGENVVDIGTSIRDRRSGIHDENEYRFTDFQYSYTLALPYASFMSDDGFFLGGLIDHQVPAFKKYPYGQGHFFNVNYAFATNGYQISWKGRFVNAVGIWDYRPSLLYQTPRYTNNFYGLGNETESVNNRDFYRVRTKIFKVTSGVVRQYNGGSSIAMVPQFEQVKIENTDDRLISEISSTLRPGVFQNQAYAGLDIVFNHEQKYPAVYPVNGLQFNGSIGWKHNLSVVERSFIRLSQSLTFYIPVNRNKTVVYATQFVANQIVGDFDFYHGITVGGLTTLRGLRPERLTGRASLAHSNDLRIPLFHVRNNLLPFLVGVTGSFDHGRVYTEKLESTDWHISYGGSLWINFLNAAVIRAGWHYSIDGSRALIALGYAF